MNKPIRIQRKRIKGFKMPANTTSVTRPGKWGNPFTVASLIAEAKEQWLKFGQSNPHLILNAAQEQAVNLFRAGIEGKIDNDLTPAEYAQFEWMRANLHQLRGKNLACFCSTGSCCHADVLLEFANA
ncbi:DUF4326 domain-containing protein [Hymenobacter coalescens]